MPDKLDLEVPSGELDGGEGSADETATADVFTGVMHVHAAAFMKGNEMT
jgi:hypothetical protein